MGMEDLERTADDLVGFRDEIQKHGVQHVYMTSNCEGVFAHITRFKREKPYRVTFFIKDYVRASDLKDTANKFKVWLETNGFEE